MKNLEQVRAANALAYAKAGLTHAVNKAATSSKSSRFDQATGCWPGAFAYGQKEDSGWQPALTTSRNICRIPKSIVPGQDNLEKLLNFASRPTARCLLATEEALAWLSYARRFEQTNGEGGE